MAIVISLASLSSLVYE